MKIISIDQSFTSCAIVVFKDDEMVHAERFVSNENMDIFDRTWEIANHIRKVSNEYSPDLIALEGLAYGKMGNATRDLAGLQFVIVTTLRHFEKVKVAIISPNTVKKVATGKGNSKKELLVEALPPKIKNIFGEKMGLKKTTGLYDLTDAYWIGVAAAEKMNKGDNK